MYENIICPACESRTFDVISVDHRFVEIDADTDEVKRLNIIDSDTQVIFCHQCEAVIVDNTQQSDEE